DSLSSGLENLFTSFGQIIAGTKTIGQAFKELALSIIQSLEQVIAKMLVVLILQKLLGAFAGGSGGGGSIFDGPLGVIIPGLPGGVGAAAGDFFSAHVGGRIIRV